MSLMYALYETATGKLISASRLPINNQKPHIWSVKEVEGPHRVWNTQTLQFDDFPRRIKLTPHDLFSRMTDNEFGSLITQAKTLAAAEVFMRRMDMQGDRPLSADQLLRARTLLVNRGILTEARAVEVCDVE